MKGLPERSWTTAKILALVIVTSIAAASAGAVGGYLYSAHSSATLPKGFVQVSGSLPTKTQYSYEQFSLTFRSTSYEASAVISYNSDYMNCSSACVNWYSISLPPGQFNVSLTITGASTTTPPPGTYDCGTLTVSSTVSSLRYDFNC
jgi:hypothetical protein